MTLPLYLTFLFAAAVLILIPGPNVSLVIANSIAYGARRGLLTVAGTSTAIALQLTIVCIGVSSLLALIASWFEWLRWVGVAYLVWLGVQHWRSGADRADRAAKAPPSSRALFLRGFLVSATNPKTLFFYAAFFPQFVDPSAPAVTQMVALSAGFLVLATLLDSSYALSAGRLSGWLVDRRRARLRNRVTGTLLIGAGVGLALARRGA